MINSRSPQDEAFFEFRPIRLAIKKDASHIGIVFQVEIGGLNRLIHLGFHHELHCQELAAIHNWVSSYAWLDLVGFSDRELLQIAVWIETIWNVNGTNVPYGIAYSGSGYFDYTTGRFIQSQTGKGLTCATFVMAVFEDFHLPLLDWNTWNYRDTDQGFLNHIVGCLDDAVAAGNADAMHVQSQKNALGIAPRFRPSEVAVAGGAYLGEPIPFVTAELLSRHLQVDLNNL